MMYTTAAKTDKPTDLKALWISFGDGAFSKKNDSHASDLSFNRSSPRGECGLSNIFSKDLLIVMTVMTNQMYFPHQPPRKTHVKTSYICSYH